MVILQCLKTLRPSDHDVLKVACPELYNYVEQNLKGFFKITLSKNVTPLFVYMNKMFWGHAFQSFFTLFSNHSINLHIIFVKYLILFITRNKDSNIDFT